MSRIINKLEKLEEVFDKFEDLLEDPQVKRYLRKVARFGIRITCLSTGAYVSVKTNNPEALISTIKVLCGPLQMAFNHYEERRNDGEAH